MGNKFIYTIIKSNSYKDVSVNNYGTLIYGHDDEIIFQKAAIKLINLKKEHSSVIEKLKKFKKRISELEKELAQYLV